MRPTCQIAITFIQIGVCPKGAHDGLSYSPLCVNIISNIYLQNVITVVFEQGFHLRATQFRIIHV